VLTDANGVVKPAFSKDEVHPTPEGYAAMRPVAEAAIR
jgi:lysophospholipase L1-like esterase